MKILLPCPGCRHPLVLPRYASSSARLRCSRCGHALAAKSIFIDSSQLGGAWEVVEDSGSDNVFEWLYQAASSDTLASQSIDGDVLRELGVDVPQSNEWETQSSSLIMDEPLETEAAFQIASEFRSSEVGNLGETAEFQNEAVPDEMIGVSDEPWFSPMEEHKDTETATEGFIEDRQDTDFDTLLEKKAENSNAGMFDPIQEHAEMELDSEPDSEPVLMLDDEDDESPPSTDMFNEEPESEAVEHSEFELIEEAEEAEEELAIHAPEVRRRTPQILPVELLGNSSSVLRARKKGSPLGTLLSVVGGGVAAIPISILLMWYALGKDPLDAGPMVANLAPWIVPEKFRGSGIDSTEQLPEMPTMVGPGFSEVVSDAPMKLPNIGDMAVAEPVTESIAKAPSEPAMKPASEPEVLTGISEPSTPLSITPTIDLATASPSVSEMPNLNAVPDAFSTSTSSVEPTEITSRDNAITKVSKIEHSVVELKKAIEVFDAGAFESGAIVFRALESFGEQLAAIPEASPERALWRAKGEDACQTIVSDLAVLNRFKVIISKGDSSNLFPSERVDYKTHEVSIDLVKVSAVEKGTMDNIWQVAMRIQKSLEMRPVMVSHSLGYEGEPEKESGFVVIGETEVEPETRQSVVRGIFVLPIRTK